MFVRLRSQIRKELLSVLRDPKARMILVGPPLVQLFVFSFAATLEVRNLDIAVLDQSRSAVSLDLVGRVENAWFVDRLLTVSSLGELEESIERQQAVVALHIRDDLSRELAAGRPGRIQVILDGRRANTAQIALGYLGSITRDLSVDLRGPGALGGQSVPRTVTRHWFNPNLTYQWFIVPSLSGILAMLIALLVTALSIARERELGTFDQLLVSPASPLEIVVGKIVPALFLGTVLGLVMAGAAVFVFGVPYTGSFWLMLPSLVLFILSVVGIGLVISSISRTQQQAILGTFAIAIPTILVSGFATPVENMPNWLQAIAQASPLKHYFVIVQGSFLKALPPSEVLANAWPMAVIAAVTLTTSVLFVRWRLQ